MLGESVRVGGSSRSVWNYGDGGLPYHWGTVGAGWMLDVVSTLEAEGKERIVYCTHSLSTILNTEDVLYRMEK